MSDSLDASVEIIERKVQAALDAPALSVRAKADLITQMAQRNLWPQMLSAFERLLAHRKAENAEVLAEVYFSAALEGRGFECNKSMALLLNCGIRSGTTLGHSAAYNLILSTCVEMKGVDYQSGYAPEDDPEIRVEMDRLNTGS